MSTLPHPLGSALVSRIICQYSLDVESYVSRLDADSIRASGSVVIKVTAEVADEFLSPTDGASLRHQLLGRLRGYPAFLLTIRDAERHVLYEVQENTLIVCKDENAIFSVRQQDIARVLQVTGSKGILTLPPNHHFVTPSGVHATKFLRVADLMQDLPSLDLFSYWLRPHVYGTQAILADNWNITPVILRTLLLLGKDVTYPFDFLPGHVIHEPASTHRIINRLANVVGSGGTVLCVLSANSSGRYVNRLREFFQSVGRPNTCVPISLFRFQDADTTVPTLFELPFDSGNVGDDQSCSLCKKQSITVRVDPHFYYVREREEKPILLGTRHFNARSFLDSYGATPGALHVHHDDPHDGRHHAFYIDIGNLLKCASFQEKFAKALDSIQKPDLIYVPDHSAGKALAEFASSHLGVPYIYDKNDIRPSINSPDEHTQRMRGARHLLILDDVIISGSRLEKINCALRESFEQYGEFESITYLVALSRMESQRVWDQLKNALTTKHNWKAVLVAVETILLPHWKGPKCPWCIEKAALSEASRKFGTPPEWITKRLNNLSASDNELMASPLLTLSGNPCPTLGAQSPLARQGASAIEVLFAISSALQGMRTDSNLADQLSEDYLTSRVVSTENITRFSEALIRATLLRVVMPSEWGQENRVALSKSLLEQIQRNDHAIIIGELALAIYRGSVTYQDVNVTIKTFPQDVQAFFNVMFSL